MGCLSRTAIAIDNPVPLNNIHHETSFYWLRLDEVSIGLGDAGDHCLMLSGIFEPFHLSPSVKSNALMVVTFAAWAGVLFPLRGAESAVPALPPPAKHSVDFVKDIQPILSDRCYSCHGPD